MMILKDALRRPRLLAAAACFALGAATLLLSLLPPLAPAPTPLAAPLDLAPAGPPVAPADLPVAPAELVVYVTGAVPRPDVYRLAPDARVKDAVLAAGGLTADAATDQINLAEPLSDAAHIHIPALAELAPAGFTPAIPASDPAPAAGGLLDLNTATAAELEDLPGIGATLAGRIVAHRDEAGPFVAVEDLREVSGVGEKLYAQIAPLVTVGP